MCLSTLWSKEKQKEWLKKQKDPLVLYAKARKEGNRFRPAIYPDRLKYAAGRNDAEEPCFEEPVGDGQLFSYLPYFHRFIRIGSARKWARESRSYRHVLKWLCQKKDVKYIGTQAGKIVVVARYMTLIGEV